MSKSKKIFLKVAETFTKKADQAWAKAKSGDGGHYYESAGRFYDTADKARRRAGED